MSIFDLTKVALVIAATIALRGLLPGELGLATWVVASMLGYLSVSLIWVIIAKACNPRRNKE
jgi:hypothetical protein